MGGAWRARQGAPVEGDERPQIAGTHDPETGVSPLSRLVVVAGNTPRDRQPIVVQSSPRSWGCFQQPTNQKESYELYICYLSRVLWKKKRKRMDVLSLFDGMSCGQIETKIEKGDCLEILKKYPDNFLI